MGKHVHGEHSGELDGSQHSTPLNRKLGTLLIWGPCAGAYPAQVSDTGLTLAEVACLADVYNLFWVQFLGSVCNLVC